MKVEIKTEIKHNGNPRGPGRASAKIVYIDSKGQKHERDVEAEVKDDTKNALALRVVTAALRILTKPCEVDLELDNGYIKGIVQNGWLENWKKRGWIKANGQTPANLDLWKGLYLSINLHKINFIEGGAKCKTI